MVKERRKKRIIIVDDKKITTIRTYKRFRKFLLEKGISKYSYSRRTKIYSSVLISPVSKIRVVKKPKREIQKKLVEEPEQRIRKQVVLNLRSHEEPYAVSVRAITINPEINENGLKMTIIETLREVDLNLNGFYKKEFGFASQKLAENEDKRLNDFRVHVEILIKKNPPINFIK